MSSIHGISGAIRNQIVDPHIRINPRIWQTQAVQVNGIWRVTLSSDKPYGTFCRPPAVTGSVTDHYKSNPCVFYLRFRKSADATLRIYRGGGQIDAGDDWTAWLVDGTTDSGAVNPSVELDGQPDTAWCEPLEHGCFSISDWETLRALAANGVLPTPWCAGDSNPVA